jgi:predicted HD superfamily hydrolase involved in NAD metabolism
MKHVLGVEQMAFRLGLLFFWGDDESMNILSAAALLHDVTKERTDEQQLDILREYKYNALPEELASMPTIHALTGALVIPKDFPEFADERLINAVKWHTTGKAGMNLYEKIIFLADYIEENREYESCKNARKEYLQSEKTNKSIDKLVYGILKNTIDHLKEKKVYIHPLTLEAMEYYNDER